MACHGRRDLALAGREPARRGPADHAVDHRCRRRSRPRCRRSSRTTSKANPNKVKDIRIQRAPQPELPAKIKAQQDAGRLDINLIMTGQAAASALIANDQLVRLLPDHEKLFPLDDFTDAATAHLKEGEGYVIPSVGEQRRPGLHLQSEEGAEPAEDRAGTARLGEGQSGQVLLCAAVQQRPGHVGHRRPALHPRRQGSQGSGERLGQDLGLPQGARPVHRILPDRHAVHAARVRAGAALDDRRHHGMGHEAARAKRSSAGVRRSPSWRTPRSRSTGTIGRSRRACRRTRSTSSST